MGIMIKCLLFLDVSACQSERNLGDDVGICGAGAHESMPEQTK